MLDSLRNAARSWVAKLLLGVLVLSFGAWGIADVFRADIGGNAVLSSGSSEVTPTQFRLAYDRQIQMLSQQFGQRLTRDQAQAFGITNQVLAQLGAGVVLDEGARQMKLGLSEDRLLQLTAQDPAFQNASGQFDKTRFVDVLRQAGMRPEDYLKERGDIALRQQIVEAVADGVKAPATLLKAMALYQGESRTIDYITLPLSSVGEIPNPSDAELKTYFDAHLAEYRAPEYRKITYVKLAPEDIAKLSSVTPEEIKDYYDKNIARYTTPESRAIQQLAFPDEAAAKAAQAKIAAGTSFDDLVKEQGKTLQDVTLGTYTKDTLPEKPVAEAAFALPEGGVSGVVNGAFGPVILRVTAITPQKVTPLAEAETDIRKALAVSAATKEIPALHDGFEDARSSGTSMADAASKLNLKAVTIAAVDKDGNGPDGKAVADIPEQGRLLPGAFQTDAGVDNDALPLGNNGYLWYQVDSITPARDRALDEVKDKVIAQWKAEQAQKKLADKVGELKKRLDGGATIDALAGELQLQKQTKRGITRTGKDTELSPDAVSQVFSGPNGMAGIAPAADGSQIVFKVIDAVEPASTGPDSLPENERKAIDARLSDDLLDQLVAKFQTEFPVKVNQTAVERALAY
ncbi:peptidyl-prolyl cis-trans isomerase [Phyllobacterium leguminum]|uniref:Parvulin-like PPIase n=1 Tax=Phyllobacterium leguminum TaxID=314237 RepID=A0A318T1Q7_9HYPH|nr:peptidyl-prolyl cis-trans isomerase [Phyllobacterium leguminum]PYE88256.1 peptidyl-prolyl cis-trans isomerase D [Phyllobacterium leguminum]